MKRRSFLQAVGGAIAAVFAPVVSANKTKPIGRLYALEENKVVTWAESNEPTFWEYHPPETVAELRAAIESAYKSVRPPDPPIEEILVHPLGMTSYGAAVDFPQGPLVKFTGLRIIGDGANEREAVLSAFNSVKEKLGGDELIWRINIELFDANDFASNRSWMSVRGMAMVR